MGLPWGQDLLSLWKDELGSGWFSNETLVQSFNKWGSRRNSRSRSKDLSDNRWRSLVPGNLVSKTSEFSSHPSIYSTLSTPSGKFHDRFLQKSSEQSCWNPVPVLNKSRRSWFGAAVSGGLSETLRPQQQPRSTQLLCFGLFRSTLFSHKMFPSDFKLYHLQLHPDSSIGNLTMRIRNAYMLAFWFWWQDTKIQIKG